MPKKGQLKKRARQRRERLESFNPEGSGYDYISAQAAGLTRDSTGHLPSRVPSTGLILKGRAHKTFHKTEAAEKALGYRIVSGSGGRLFSVKPPRRAR